MLHLSKQSGIVMILALLVITAALTASAVFGNLIIRGLQQSRLVDQSIQAYYLAESGAERALYQVRQREALHDCGIVSGTACTDKGYCLNASSVPCVTGGSSGLIVPAGWSVAAAPEKSVTKYLQPGESFQIDLFNPYQQTGSGKLETVEVIQVENKDLSFDFTLYAQLTNLTWLIGGTPSCPLGAPVIASGFITSSYNNQLQARVVAISGLAGADINSNCLYSLRLSNPLLTPPAAGMFTISLHSAAPATDANRVDVPSRLLVTAAADSGQSHQTVKVRTPVRPPLSGLYDFVLFSDTEIVK